jgi:hypothetical protein
MSRRNTGSSPGTSGQLRGRQPLMAHVMLPWTQVESQQLGDGETQMRMAVGINGKPAERSRRRCGRGAIADPKVGRWLRLLEWGENTFNHPVGPRHSASSKVPSSAPVVEKPEHIV